MGHEEEGLMPSKGTTGGAKFKGETRQGFPLVCSWKIKAWRPETGEIVHEEEAKNIVVKVGKDDMLRLLFGLSGSSYVALAAGACSTAATVDDTQLNYEHILNPSRKSLTNTSDVALSASDIASEDYTEDTCDFHKKITVRGVYETGDANNGHPFQEYGLFTTDVLPATPTSAQPTMFNHFVAATPITKDASTEIVVDITVRV